jgi:starch phosphorylase
VSASSSSGQSNTESANSLHTLASNLRWTWHTPTQDLLRKLPNATAADHPLHTLANMSPEAIEQFAEEAGAEVKALRTQLDALIDATPTPAIAYFSPEFGVAAQVPQYSGGLGILAGDHLKSASDLGVPLLGIGLMYRNGFFRQDITDGIQTERYETIEPTDIGAVDTGATIHVPIAGRQVKAKVWRQMVGATQLILLDTDVASNTAEDKLITDMLYSGDRRHRLDQELMLGVGGVRALRALGISPEVFHLNEGHACFLLLELLGEQTDTGTSITDAVADVRSKTLFTTHTPVPAGIDRFDRSLAEPELAPWADRLGVKLKELMDWATMPSDGAKKPFNTAALAFELCGRANGVSQLHAEVSRDLFKTIPRAAKVEGITNGVHARTWVTPPLQDLYDRVLGAGWENGNHDAWANVANIDASEFRDIRDQGRRALTDLVAESTGVKLNPDQCVIGFARRFATYKRAALLLRDKKGLEASLESGAQFVFAGKAHPADNEGKAVLAEIVAFAESKAAQRQIVLIPDYDIAIAQTMYAGCDVWLNNPVRPREACGTSGEKAALSGGLNFSILDGWWADWFSEGIGWAIPTSDAADDEIRDDAEARALHALLTTEVMPKFASPDQWWDTTVRMLSHLGPLVTAGRMVAEYNDRFYLQIQDS